jgi:hypothetical protein
MDWAKIQTLGFLSTLPQLWGILNYSEQEHYISKKKEFNTSFETPFLVKTRVHNSPDSLIYIFAIKK